MYIDGPAAKLVLLCVVSFTVANHLRMLRAYSILQCSSLTVFPGLLRLPAAGLVSILWEAGFLGAERGRVFDTQALAPAHGRRGSRLGCSFACFYLFPGSRLGF